jgi:hypothetical protein
MFWWGIGCREWGDGEMGRWGDGELGAPTTDREWGLGAVGRWGVWGDGECEECGE